MGPTNCRRVQRGGDITVQSGESKERARLTGRTSLSLTCLVLVFSTKWFPRLCRWSSDERGAAPRRWGGGRLTLFMLALGQSSLAAWPAAFVCVHSSNQHPPTPHIPCPSRDLCRCTTRPCLNKVVTPLSSRCSSGRASRRGKAAGWRAPRSFHPPGEKSEFKALN